MNKLTTAPKAYERQIRRYIQAPVHRFAAIVPPELVPFCEAETVAMGLAEQEIKEAGVEFKGKLVDCYRANLWLRTASRILYRFPSFRAGALEELFRKGVALRWDLWLNPRIPLQVKSHVKLSRICHEGQVRDTLIEAIQKHFRLLDISPPESLEDCLEEEGDDSHGTGNHQRIFIRLKNNQCEISLDTTGAHLHRRGYRLQHTGAPLRETLAAAILFKVGWRGDCPLVDGMCGAGTVPVEGALMARRLPPGLKRSFLFEEWPSFQSKTWAYLCNKAEEDSLASSPVPLIGLDRDPQALAVAVQNAERAGVSRDIRWECTDFFDFGPSAFDLEPGVLILNPPYGKRMSGGGEEFYARLGSHLRRYFKGWKIAVLIPDSSLATRLGLRSVRFWRIIHGGSPVLVTLGRISN